MVNQVWSMGYSRPTISRYSTKLNFRWIPRKKAKLCFRHHTIEKMSNSSPYARFVYAHNNASHVIRARCGFIHGQMQTACQFHPESTVCILTLSQMQAFFGMVLLALGWKDITLKCFWVPLWEWSPTTALRLLNLGPVGHDMRRVSIYWIAEVRWGGWESVSKLKRGYLVLNHCLGPKV